MPVQQLSLICQPGPPQPATSYTHTALHSAPTTFDTPAPKPASSPSQLHPLAGPVSTCAQIRSRAVTHVCGVLSPRYTLEEVAGAHYYRQRKVRARAWSCARLLLPHHADRFYKKEGTFTRKRNLKGARARMCVFPLTRREDLKVAIGGYSSLSQFASQAQN